MAERNEKCDGCVFWDETREFCFFFQGGCLWETPDDKKDDSDHA